MSNITPNVNISDPAARKVIGGILYALAILSGATSIVVGFWPELTALDVDVVRIISTVNALVSFFSGVFGVAVTLPNVPKKDGTVVIDLDK
jgi:uncharacterized membrane protein YozB (DUF420 family)